MASKKKRRTKAQRAATKRLVALNKKRAKKGGKKRSKKKSGKKRTGGKKRRVSHVPRSLTGATRKKTGKKRSGKKRGKRASRPTTVNPGLRTQRVQGGNPNHRIAHEAARLASLLAKASKTAAACRSKLAKTKAKAKAGGNGLKQPKMSGLKRPKMNGQGKGQQALSAEALIRGAQQRRLKAWICAGVKRTGCGGGKATRRGSRVIGILN